MSTRSWRLGLLGHPVAHSISPALHAAALDATAQSGTYSLVECAPADLEAAVGRLRRGEFDGLNATIPHKEALLAHVDETAPSAGHLGAINTLVRTERGAIVGHNTDLEGLVAALQTQWPSLPWDQRPVVVVGAGGAARAAVMAAVALGASEVRLTNRTVARAETVAQELQPFSDVPILAHPEVGAFEGATLVLQATSAGLSWTPEEARWDALMAQAVACLARVAQGAVLMDLIYRPRLTPWMQAAQSVGLETAGGLGMLVGQAAAAFACWTGVRPPTEPMHRAASVALTQGTE